MESKSTELAERAVPSARGDPELPGQSDRVSAGPQAAVRGKGLMRRAWRAVAILDGVLNRCLPKSTNPLAHAGQVANLCLVQAVATGILMLLWYSPSSEQAYQSLAEMGWWGQFVRAAHRYSSDLLMLFLFVHAGRVFFAGKFAGPRWLPWVTGVGLMFLVWLIGWTGYWLPWDSAAQQVAVTSMQLLDALPLFGEPLGRFFLADRLVPSLLFFVVFFLHMLLPLGIAVGLVAHLIRLSRVRLFPGWPLCVGMTLGLLAVSALAPAPLDGPAQMAVKPDRLTVDAWYMTPLALGLRFQGVGLWVALFGGVGLAAAIPWLLGRRRRSEAYQATVDVSRCHACTQCVQDCPFDAVKMVPRADGKRFDAQASVDPARCVGCGVCAGSCDSEGIGLAWFPTSVEETRIQEAFTNSVKVGGPKWVALVASDVDGGLDPIDRLVWEKRLPGYQVFGVPTASWTRSKLVEKLLKRGASGALIVRNGSGESQARDGGRWVEDRLAGTRGPAFRPARAGGQANWRVVDFEAGNAQAFEREASAFRSGEALAAERPLSKGRLCAAVLVLAVGLGVAAVAPSHLVVENPAPMDPELVFSFKAEGALLESSDSLLQDDADRPVHMRGRSFEKPRRAAVRARVSVDGSVVSRAFEPKGWSNDGPSIGVIRLPIAPGRRFVTIELRSGDDRPVRFWEGWIEAEKGRVQVITYQEGGGFRLE